MARNEKRLLARLPARFRLVDATKFVTEQQLIELISAGRLTKITHGWYGKTHEATPWDELAVIAAKCPDATICLRSALAYHGLIDDIARTIDVGIPRGGSRITTPVPVPVQWHTLTADRFTLHREELPVGPHHRIGIYTAPRSIVDSLRLPHQVKRELVYQALTRWLNNGGQPSSLLEIAEAFPRGLLPLKRALASVS